VTKEMTVFSSETLVMLYASRNIRQYGATFGIVLFVVFDIVLCEK
jgi:hypothetical protein